MGRVYLIEHCIYQHNAKMRRQTCEVYITDRLKAINDSVVHAFGGATAKQRYADYLEEMIPKNEAQNERTAEEVISTIFDKIERLNNDESI